MKKVLITGGAGFIAHHLIEHILKTTDWDIISLDRLDFSGNLNRLAEVVNQYDSGIRQRVKVIFHDLKAELNHQIVKAIGDVDIILHLAASSHVDRSIEFPMEFIMDNVVGTCNILNYARSLPKLERFIYFSTDEVFGPAPSGVNYDEYARYNSSNPYSASKAGGEEIAVAFANTYKLPLYITHTMNVFGERQHPEKYIPVCIKRVRDGEKITIHSDPTKTIPGSRYYIHANDVSSALLFILNLKDQPNGSKFNVVGREEINNLQLAQMIADVQGKELIYELSDFHSARPGHDLRYALSGDRMRNLGWEPQISLKDRISEVVQWTLANDRWL
ncbi:NAD-dependent epimerase/dehydratase family protein [bacterium]|nr:NAD-dependent epimerase/dehydratase family protein [bacterium]